jgi:hypothetical protein
MPACTPGFAFNALQASSRNLEQACSHPLESIPSPGDRPFLLEACKAENASLDVSTSR